jgi:hypothetical protein
VALMGKRCRQRPQRSSGAQLEALAGVTQVAGGGAIAPRSRSGHGTIARLGGRQGVQWPHHARRHSVATALSDGDAERRQHPPAAGTSTRRMPSASATSQACNGPAPPKRDQLQPARVVAALDRDDPDRSHHLLVGHRDHALRRRPQAPEPGRQRPQRPSRQHPGERCRPGRQSVEPAEHQVGIGHGRLLAAAP